jgi:hypothetical protein
MSPDGQLNYMVTSKVNMHNPDVPEFRVSQMVREYNE